MARVLRKRATGIFNKAPSFDSPTSSRPVSSHNYQHRRVQTLQLTLPLVEEPSIAPAMADTNDYNFRPVESPQHSEPLFDDSFMSHISVEFAKMRPWDFKLPEYEFYTEPSDSWFDDQPGYDDFTIDDLALNTDLVDEDIATKIYFARPGKPRVIDVSPPPSIRSRRSESTSTSSSHHQHSRSSSYTEPFDSKSSASYESDNDDEATTPDTPTSGYSDRSKTFFPVLKPAPPMPPQRNPHRKTNSIAPLEPRSRRGK